MENYKNWYDLAYRAHCGTSFTPDKRAKQFCEGFKKDIEVLEALNIPAERIERYKDLVRRHLQVKSRCVSTMIAGGSNFPVRRAEKANQSERKAAEMMISYYNKIVDFAKKEKYYAENPEARPIMAGDSDALERLEKEVLALRTAQDTMVLVNKILRKKPIDSVALLAALGTQQKVDMILKPDYAGHVGFARYQLTNNLANLKRVEARLEELKKRKASTPKDFMVNGVRVLENTEAMRLQLFFDGKPSADVIQVLKSNAFKWAPSIGAWQRQLTNNAVYSFNHFVLPALK